MTASGARSVGMKQRPQIYYTKAQKALMWDRWKAGDTLHEIGKLFDRPHTSIHTILSRRHSSTGQTSISLGVVDGRA
jgi:hypothetical protein